MEQEIQIQPLIASPPPPPPPQQQQQPPPLNTSATSTTTTNASNTKSKKLRLLPLIFLIYFEVSGGPYGAENAVRAAGPLLTLTGFLVIPFVCSLPEALITAELSTSFPGNGGFVLWAIHAFNPITASLTGSFKFLSSTINTATFPNLCSDYLSPVFPSLAAGAPRGLFITLLIITLSFINYTGLTIVGYVAVALGIVSLLPFVLMTCMAAPEVRPARWTEVRKKIDWGLYMNTLFWNMNYWDNASTLAGEVDQPQRSFPRAILAAGILTCVSYFVPILAVTGAVDVSDDSWTDGFFADAAGNQPQNACISFH
ncbi:hypothetical protein J5N97_014083 [Dioscorea zingiberensis]|uniref:Uncharacterized protein n=1 Tax=Dioscorea zingiberensis TaxID=325984 RepID=A0A9D5CT93_9LILI|nr:hypothetical protein J5N97_014083 [Dioscorea zingiberensis]